MKDDSRSASKAMRARISPVELVSAKLENGGGGWASVHENSARVAVAEAVIAVELADIFQVTGGEVGGSSSAKPRRVMGARKAAGIFF